MTRLLSSSSWRTPAVVLACGGLILMLALGTRQSFGLFLRPMSLDLGWGREAFSFAIALQNLVWGCAMPFAGAIADRYGAGRVLVAGGLAYGGGLIAMAHATDPLGFNLAAGLLVGLGLACTGFGVVMAVVARAFPPQKRSVAVGIAGACGSFGQFAMLPWGQALISSYGWLNALVALGVVSFLMIPLGAALAGRNAAEAESTQSIGAALAEASQHRGFWLLTASFFVCGFQTIFVMTHLPAYLVDRGLSANQGMTTLAVVGLFDIVGFYGCGALGRRYSRAVDPRLDLRGSRRRHRHVHGRTAPVPGTISRHGARPHLARHGAAHHWLVGKIFGVKFLWYPVLDRLPRRPARHIHRRVGRRRGLRRDQFLGCASR